MKLVNLTLKLLKKKQYVYKEYFNKPYPARETVEVSSLPKNVNVEISMIASCK